MKRHLYLLVSVLLICNLLGAQNAPVTKISSLYGCTPGSITVPVTVYNYSGIGAFALDLQYDPSVLTFVSCTKNPSLIGSFMSGASPLPGGLYHVVISWFGSSSTLSNGSTLLNIDFTFIGGTTDLNWNDDGGSCEYANASYFPLVDTPTGCFYYGGTVTSSRLLNLSLYLEGLYDPASGLMNSALGLPIDPCSEQVADYVTVELHNSSDFDLVEYSITGRGLDVNGHVNALVPAGLNGSYYVAVKHRNSIETVSSLPVSLAAAISEYNFTNSASRAYGNNMVQVADGYWALFTGDTNQDGIVDSGDMIMVDNDVSGFVTGYVASDCNGDNLVDSSDMILVDNNAAAFITAIYP